MKKILIVEDDPIIQEVYRIKLQNSGFEVLLASEGQEGLDKMENQQPDLVILDILMPNLNGLDALKMAKQNEKTKNIPIAVFSNIYSEDDKKQMLQAGAIDYIVKTDIDPEKFLERVNKIFEHHVS